MYPNTFYTNIANHYNPYIVHVHEHELHRKSVTTLILTVTTSDVEQVTNVD